MEREVSYQNKEVHYKNKRDIPSCSLFAMVTDRRKGTRRGVGMADDEDDALARSLHACARQLETLCEELGLDAFGDDSGRAISDEEQRSWCQERENGDEEEEEPPGGSAVEMARACMQMLASMETIRLVRVCEREPRALPREGGADVEVVVCVCLQCNKQP